MKFLKNKWFAFTCIVLLFLGTRLLTLTKLPVFADEAIYIRWSQVGQNEPDRYLFLPMLDGKPPLHTWLITIARSVVGDPLLAARLLSVVAGGFTAVYWYALAKIVTGNTKAAYFGVIVSIVMPSMYLMQRMGLAESLLTLFFSAGLYHGLKIMLAKSKGQIIVQSACFGLAFGAALFTKVSALFFVLPYAVLPLLVRSMGSKISIIKITQLFFAGLLGGSLFLTLKNSDLFPFLFSRSQDYTFTIREIMGGEWRYVLFASLPKVIGWIIWYSSPLLLVLPFFEKKTNRVLISMILLYMLPLVAVGKTLYPRYFTPVSPLLMLMIVVGMHEMRAKSATKKMRNIIVAGALTWSALFITVHSINPDNTWYVAADRKQYLEDWSSGHGIPEVRDFIRKRLRESEVVVATEGFFGTLPDGLMMYFDGTEAIKNLELYGIGQPISSLPADLFEKAKTKEVYVVVNSHRFTMPLTPRIQKVGEFPRPHSGPSLLVLKISAT